MIETFLIDTHSHVDMLEESTVEEAIAKAKENGIEKIIVPCAYPKDIEKIYELVNKYDELYGLLGVHPSEVKDWDDIIIELIKKFAPNEKIVGIGEIGLDYYWDKSFNELQKEIFIKQVNLANELNLPISIHDRDAHKDTFDILKKYNKNSKIVLHCFSGSVEFAQECIKEGWYIALGGVVTFKNAIKMKEVAVDIPLDRLLLETDAPYLTPVPYRGKENEPAYLKFVAEEIAKLRGISINEVAKETTKNAIEVFGL